MRALSCFAEAVALINTAEADWPLLYVNEQFCSATGGALLCLGAAGHAQGTQRLHCWRAPLAGAQRLELSGPPPLVPLAPLPLPPAGVSEPACLSSRFWQLFSAAGGGGAQDAAQDAAARGAPLTVTVQGALAGSLLQGSGGGQCCGPGPAPVPHPRLSPSKSPPVAGGDGGPLTVELKPATADHLSAAAPHIGIPNFIEGLGEGGGAGAALGWTLCAPPKLAAWGPCQPVLGPLQDLLCCARCAAEPADVEGVQGFYFGVVKGALGKAGPGGSAPRVAGDP